MAGNREAYQELHIGRMIGAVDFRERTFPSALRLYGLVLRASGLPEVMVEEEVINAELQNTTRQKQRRFVQTVEAGLSALVGINTEQQRAAALDVLEAYHRLKGVNGNGGYLEGMHYLDAIQELCKECPGPVSRVLALVGHSTSNGAGLDWKGAAIAFKIDPALFGVNGPKF